MTKRLFILASCSFFSAAAQTQTPRLVRAVGEAVVSVKPDLARLNVGVVTQATTAQAAASQNATQVDAVLTQLRQVLGANADIKTISYSLAPYYKYSQDAPPTLLGYAASNNLQVNSADLSVIGRIIDTAGEAGANNVGGLVFTLKDPEPVRLQVLGMAAKQAKTHAEAIAAGFGGRIGSMLAATEGATVSPIGGVFPGGGHAGDAIPTPIETGLVQVRGSVTVEAELIP